jgi:hypothetical protein
MSWGRRGDDESRRAHVIVGPPGSGRSTQAGRLAERLDLVHLSPGALFREMAPRWAGGAATTGVTFGYMFYCEGWLAKRAVCVSKHAPLSICVYQ